MQVGGIPTQDTSAAAFIPRQKATPFMERKLRDIKVVLLQTPAEPPLIFARPLFLGTIEGTANSVMTPPMCRQRSGLQMME